MAGYNNKKKNTNFNKYMLYAEWVTITTDKEDPYICHITIKRTKTPISLPRQEMFNDTFSGQDVVIAVYPSERKNTPEPKNKEFFDKWIAKEVKAQRQATLE